MVKAKAFQLIATKSVYESLLAGDWEVNSKVIWSECKYVKEGQTSESEIRINDVNGVLYPEWITEWRLVSNNIIDFSTDNLLKWERESSLKDGKDQWLVKSVNVFNYSEDGKFAGKSYHKQYLNGKYVGTYITYSELSRRA